MANTAEFTGTIDLEEEAQVLKDYVIGQRLGEGSYGSVFVVKYIPSGENFAVKVLQKEDLFAPVLSMFGGDLADFSSPLMRTETDEPSSPTSVYSPLDPRRKLIESLEKKIIQEATVLQALNHPHIVNFFKFFNSTVAFYFIMELAEGGELFDLIISKGYFNEDEARCFFQQLISAIDYCHREGVAHKDLKAENLLLTSDNRLVVCDFGFSSKNSFRNMDDPEENVGAGDANMLLPEENNAFNPFGTLHYMSPEAVAASTVNAFAEEEDNTGGVFTATYCNTNERIRTFSPESPIGAGAPMWSDYANSFGSNGGDSPFLRQYTEKNGSIDRVKPPKVSSSGNLSVDSNSLPPRNGNNHNHSGGSSNNVDTQCSKETKKEKRGFMKTFFGEKGPRNSRSTLFSTSSSSDDEPHHHGSTRNRRKRKADKRGGTKADVLSDPQPQSPILARPKRVDVDPFMQDLWSAGVILFFMLTGRLPFDGRDDEETMHLIEEAQFSFTEEEVERLSPETRRFVSKMLEIDPNNRPTTEEIIHHPWFTTNIDPADFPHRDDLHKDETSPQNSFLNFRNRNSVITFDEEKAISTAFHKIDTDGFGKITRDQIRDMLTFLHQDMVPSADISELFYLFTGDPNGTEITYEQFRSAWVNSDLAHTPFTHSSEFQLGNIIGTEMDEVERKVVRQLRTAFDFVDTTHSGFISVNQLRSVFEKCEIEASEEDLVSLVKFFQEQDMMEKNPSMGSGVGSTPPVSPTSFHNHNNCCSLGISFDAFVMGIVKREILLYHPLGRKLAAATNLAALFQSRNVTECVRHGFLVIGLQGVVLNKLTSVSERLLLLYTDEVVSNTENIYSFRYLGSSALLSGVRMEAAAPAFATSAAAQLSHSSPNTGQRGSMSSVDFARSLQHFSQSASSFSVSNAGNLANPVPTIADLHRSMRSKSHRLPKKMGLLSSPPATYHRVTSPDDRKDKVPPKAEHSSPLCAPTLSSSVKTNKSNQIPNTNTNTNKMTEESDDLRSNYSSDRDSMSIYGTEGARSNASSPTSKTSLGYTTAPKEDGETLKKGSSLEAAINHMEAHYSSNDLASSIPIDSHVDVMKIGGSPKNRTKTRPAPLVLPPSEKKKKVPKKNSDSGLHELSKEAKEALYPPEGHHALEMDLVNSSSGMNASTGSGKPQEGNSQRKLSQSASANSATKFGRSVSNNYSSNAFGHRHLSYGQGGSGAIGQVNGVCDVDIILAPACLGYTLVRFRRIHGKTSDFHEAVSFVTNLLELERQQAIEDIMPRGESELM